MSSKLSDITWRQLLESDLTVDSATAAQKAYAHPIPDDLRSDAWFIRTGARDLLFKNSNIYDYLCTESRPDKKCVIQIDKDLPRTFRSPQLIEQYHDPLRRILIAYSLFNPSVQYTQGMNYIAAFILHQFCQFPPSTPPTSTSPTVTAEQCDEEMDRGSVIEEQCFWTFTAIMTQIDTLFMGDLVGFHKAVDCFTKMFYYHGPPDLVRHLKAHDVFTTIFTAWYHTLFTHPAMNGNIARRIWDIFIMEQMDFAIILKVSYLILIRHKQALLRMDFVEMAGFCKSRECFEFDGGDDHDLIQRAWKLQLNELYLKPIRRLKYVVDEEQSVDIKEKEAMVMEKEADLEEEENDENPVTIWSLVKTMLPFT